MIKRPSAASFLWILTILVSTIQTPASAEQTRINTPPTCQLTITTAKDTYEAGDFVALIVKISNNGKTAILTNGSLPLLNFKLSLALPDGRSAPTTLYYSGLLKRVVEERRIFNVDPGQSMTEGINLGRAFDMSLSGTYRISLSALYFQKDEYQKPITIISNVLTIKITDNPTTFDKGEVPE
jgi:hypothetical protein